MLVIKLIMIDFVNAFYNLARGHAVIHGRNYITKDDLAIVIPTALSSAPRERVKLFRQLIEHEGKLDTEEFMKYAQVILKIIPNVSSGRYWFD